MKHTINDCSVGDKVCGNEGYSVVQTCPHGNLYYAFAGYDKPEDWDGDAIYKIRDDSEYCLDCGC